MNKFYAMIDDHKKYLCCVLVNFYTALKSSNYSSLIKWSEDGTKVLVSRKFMTFPKEEFINNRMEDNLLSYLELETYENLNQFLNKYFNKTSEVKSDEYIIYKNVYFQRDRLNISRLLGRTQPRVTLQTITEELLSPQLFNIKIINAMSKIVKLIKLIRNEKSGCTSKIKEYTSIIFYEKGTVIINTLSILKSLGYYVESCDTFDELTEKMSKQSYNYLVIDISLYKLHFSLKENILNLPSTIIFTAISSAEIQENEFVNENNFLILKPYSAKDINRIITQIQKSGE